MDQLVGVDNRPKLYDERLHQAPRPAHFGKRFYAIFRVGKRFKDMVQIKNFEMHMQREMEVPNSDHVTPNEILIGSQNVYDYVSFVLDGVKRRKDSVLCTELLLTATHGFFNMQQSDIDKWVDLQRRWLEKEFHSNCVYAVLHKDEFT